jgi:peroxiredoxin 2/4
MSLVGKKAPVFNAPAVTEGNSIVQDFSLSRYLGNKYVILLFYPKDFSGICPHELHDFNAHLREFEALDAAVVACSTDTQESHKTWLNMERAEGGIKGVNFPIVADVAKTISDAYGILAGDYDYDEDGKLVATGPMIAYRGLFLIDKEGYVKHEVVNFFTLMRSAKEALRMVEALRYFETHGEACPVK